MKINKITQSLFWLSVIAIILDFACLDLWGTANLYYLTWNLFLAWIPYLISSILIKKETPINRFMPIFIFWLLFFPNAPYLVTDVLHIASTLPLSLWYDSLLFFFFGFIGLLLGLLSLFHIHQYLKNHFSYLISEISILIICFISSFGVYLGRFERWNSWDVFIDPLHLVKDSLIISSGFVSMGTPFIFICFFTLFLYSTYKAMYVLITHKVEL